MQHGEGLGIHVGSGVIVTASCGGGPSIKIKQGSRGHAPPQVPGICRGTDRLPVGGGIYRYPQ